jgi:hypothetical protein
MGKLKEKLLNNLTPEEMDEQFELSAFEYVELVEKYKNKKEDDEYIPTEEEIAEMHKLTEEYYKSKEFQEYVEDIIQMEIDELNESMKLKYTDKDILDVLDGLVDPQKVDIILDKLNEVWNNKNGVF